MARMNVLNHIYAIGFKTFENMASGLALILPASYPLKKLNDIHQLGMVYEDATVDELTSVISYCVNNRELVLTWKKNARAAYNNEFDPEIQKKKLITELETIMACAV